MVVALGVIQYEFGLDQTLVQWVMNAYILSLASFVLVGGSLSHYLGARKGGLWGLILFAFFSFCCFLSPNIYLLLVFRAFQGISAAILIPSQSLLISRLFPKEKQGRVMGLIVSFSLGIGMVMPYFAGLLTELFSWRCLFLIYVPIALLGFFFGYRTFPKLAEEKKPFDGVGALYFVSAVGLLVIPCMNAPKYGLSYVSLLGGVLAFVLLIQRSLNTSFRFLDLSIFKYKSFASIALSISTMKFISMIGIFQMIYFEKTLHYSPSETGLLFTSSFIPTIASSTLGGFLADRYSTDVPSKMGYGLILISFLGFAFFPAGGVIQIMIPLILFGIGIPLVTTPLRALALTCLPNDKVAIGEGLLVSLQMIFASLGVAFIHVFTDFFQKINEIRLGSEVAMKVSFSWIHLFLSLIVALSFFVSLKIDSVQKRGV